MSGRIPPRPPVAGGGGPVRGGRPRRAAQSVLGAHREAEGDTFTPAPAGARSGGEAVERSPQQLSPAAAPPPRLAAGELAALAQRFAAVLAQHPGASRQRRAQLLAKTILRRRALSSVMGSLTDAEMDALCALIGDALGDAPRLGELVDRTVELVAEGGRRAGAGDPEATGP